MTARLAREFGGVAALLENVGKGRPLGKRAGEALRRLLGVRVGLDGLSRLFQPSFPGVRAFAVQVRAQPDQAVELTLVGVARDGRPVWTGTRTFAYGRDGSVEIHRGFDDVDPAYQSRNITTDLMQRELDVLAMIDAGPAARLTIDADHVGRYVCALHGFVFADETEEGPPVRSARALEPAGDRAQLIQAATALAARTAEMRTIGPGALETTLSQLRACHSPWDFARLELGPTPRELAESDDGLMGVRGFGRELLLAGTTPGWRAALYLHPRDPDTWARGAEYRRRKTVRSEARLATELQEALAGLESANRAIRLRAIETLGMIAPGWSTAELKRLAEGPDRRVAAAARQALRQISGADLPPKMLAFAEDPKNPARLRGLAYRVLAEHHPKTLSARAPMLRVYPDPRIQRATIPLVAEDPEEAGPALATLLAANPWRDDPRPGLLELRLELLELLAELADPSTLPALMVAYRQRNPPPPPQELVALSRALVGFPDPRAQLVLTEAARRLQRPQIP